MRDDVIEKPDPSRVIDYGIDVSMISLGERCWSRIFPETFHLYNFKARDVRMPFDGCITKYGAVCEMIKTDFSEAFDDLREGYLDIRTKYAIYNHEKTLDLDDFKIQMHKRITQFKNELEQYSKSKSPVIFFLQHKHFPCKLISVMREKYPNLNFKLFCVNKWADVNNNKSRTVDYCKYLEPRFGKGVESDLEILEGFFEIMREYTKQQYDINLVWSRRAKNP